MNCPLRSLWLATTLVAFGAAPAWAFRPEPNAHQGLELVSGQEVRLERRVDTVAPDGQLGWNRFLRLNGTHWRGVWDRDLRVPLRIWGRGIDAPRSVSSPAAAEAVARAVLVQHLDLFAPGAKLDDLVLVSNQLSSDGTRSIGFRQHQQGMEVIGGQVSFTFKKDRLIMIGAEALPRLTFEPGAVISESAAQSAAREWIAREIDPGATVGLVRGPFLLGAVEAEGALVSARVLEVSVETRAPIGRWKVYLEATSGRPFARRQTLMFATGVLQIDTPERRPTAARHNVGAPAMAITINGRAGTTAADGTITWTASAAAQITASATGPHVVVINDGAQLTPTSFSLAPGATHAWSGAQTELLDAQLIAFMSVTRAKDYVHDIEPMPFLTEQLQATVNISDTCNAFSDGTTVNFFRSGRGCENTGRLVDVVMHEFGHSVHAHAIIDGVGAFDTSLSEGVSDFLAATIVGDSGMGRGFFMDDRALRELDPANSENTWPRDIAQDPHETGLIIAGSLWDLRKSLVTKYGEAQGVVKTNHIWYGVLQRASDIPTSYTAALVADDDDGNLDNGTPNVCEINAAFAPHGLASRSAIGPSIGKIEENGLTIGLPVGEGALCPGADLGAATLIWEIRGQPGSGGTITMAHPTGRLEAAIPPQAEGVVVKYRVEIALANGDMVRLPDNPADPMYEMFIGAVTPIFCTDFETDPLMSGWSHRLVAGTNRQGADDWTWGIPDNTNGSGDPGQAFSGQRVIGNDLGGGNFNGLYQSNKTNELLSPMIDIGTNTNVRLQYRRWLNVEDGAFDKATIRANDTELWHNFATVGMNGATHHTDKEWRFQDVDLSGSAGMANGQIQVAFRIASDGGLEMGGWTIDDFCVVSWNGPTARCGDGTVQPGEQCDDGNQVPGDGCEADCRSTPVALCGNGMVDPGEQCDDGNTADGDGCSSTCTTTIMPGATCGDGVVQANEQCDDGNTTDGDGCSATCTLPGTPVTCGNGVVDPGEACDDGAMNGSGACAANCQPTGNPGLGQASPGGCGCSAASPRDSGAWATLALVGLLLIRRRRSR